MSTSHCNLKIIQNICYCPTDIPPVAMATPLLVSPNFPHVPLGVGGCPLSYSEGVGLIVRAIVSKISNLCGPDPPTSQTDR